MGLDFHRVKFERHVGCITNAIKAKLKYRFLVRTADTLEWNTV